MTFCAMKWLFPDAIVSTISLSPPYFNFDCPQSLSCHVPIVLLLGRHFVIVRLKRKTPRVHCLKVDKRALSDTNHPHRLQSIKMLSRNCSSKTAGPSTLPPRPLPRMRPLLVTNKDQAQARKQFAEAYGVAAALVVDLADQRSERRDTREKASGLS
jgi:hypothetical protein